MIPKMLKAFLGKKMLFVQWGKFVVLKLGKILFGIRIQLNIEVVFKV